MSISRRIASPANLAVGLAGAYIAWLAFNHYIFNIGYAVDDSFITFRYAFNFVEGFGLTFNVDERHYGSTAAGFAVLVGFAGKLLAALDALLTARPRGLQWAIPHAAGIISTTSLLLVALLNLKVAIRLFESKAAASVIAALTATVLFSARDGSVVSGHETYTYLALCYVASYLMLFACRPLAGAWALLAAVVVRPDAMLFGAILFGAAMCQRWISTSFQSALRALFVPAFVVAVGAVAWLVAMGAYYGYALPETRIAKQAQILLGYWPAFDAKTVWAQAMESLPAAMPWVVVFGATAVLLLGAVRYVMGQLRESELAVLCFAGVWVAFAILIVTAYEAMRVTYWLWYGVPLWFCFVVLVAPAVWAVSIATARLLRGAVVENGGGDEIRVGLAMPVVLATTVVLGNLGFFGHHLKRLTTGSNINAHIGSYSGVIDYIRSRHPQGTSLAMAEPGHVGFSLGPSYKVVDLLGLTSPGVARALIANDLDFPTRQWKPRYVIVSWGGKFNPDSRPAFRESYRLVATFEHAYWKANLGGPYKLYERIP